jgi:hypothetical protein
VSAAAASSDQTQKLIEIEEDFGSTRKIARASIVTTPEMTRVLLPLLPIQNPVSMTVESEQATVRSRLQEWPPAALEALFAEHTESEVLSLLMKEQ